MTKVVEARKINGSQWLHELMHGAEKAFLLREVILSNRVSTVTGRNERQIQTYKREAIRLQLETGLRGAELAVRVLTEGSEVFTGKLVEYDFNEATITLQAGKRIVTRQYGEYHIDEGMVIGSPLVELETERAYKY